MNILIQILIVFYGVCVLFSAIYMTQNMETISRILWEGEPLFSEGPDYRRSIILTLVSFIFIFTPILNAMPVLAFIVGMCGIKLDGK
jgi:hypothetical protein